MDLTPLEIRKKEFKKAMRGYDAEEVELFLEDVSDFVEILLSKHKTNEDKIELLLEELEISKKTNSAKSTEDDLNAKINSTAMVDKEAELIIREAELKALEVLEVNRAESNKIKEEIKTLKQQKNSFIKRLKHLFAAQLDLIEVLEIEDDELDSIKLLSKKIDKNRQSLTGISKVPAFKRAAKNDKIVMIDEKQETIENIEVESLKSNTASVEQNMDSIKEQAKQITSKENSTASNESLDLDNILGDLGEDN